MTDRESRDRLIEIITQKQNWGQTYEKSIYTRNVSNTKLADHLIAEGVIVPPCKVGGIVYEIQPIRGIVQEYEITTIKYNGHYWWFTWILKDRKGIYGNVEGFSSHQIGKTVFLTKEDAEAKLVNYGSSKKDGDDNAQ